MRINHVMRVELMGGLIGLLTTNPRKALEKAITKANKLGWTATHIDKHGSANLLVWVVQLAVLICTLGLWTWSEGYLVLLEKEEESEQDTLGKQYNVAKPTPTVEEEPLVSGIVAAR